MWGKMDERKRGTEPGNVWKIEDGNDPENEDETCVRAMGKRKTLGKCGKSLLSYQELPEKRG